MDPLDRTSLTHQAAEAIKRQVLIRHLQAGARLPSERQLCETLGISRNILREALSTLVAQGIVEKVPGRGAFVGEFNRRNLDVDIRLAITDESELGALHDLRMMLELGAAELVVQRGTPEDLDRLEAVIDHLEEKMPAGDGLGELDIEFHLAMFQAAHSPALFQLYKQVLRDVTDVEIYQHPERRGIFTEQFRVENISLLRQVLEALRGGDVCEAQRAIMAHIAL
jgi:GntR family transcriptional regulator, transcriptional repressor for pyruvate dehydrogenase complex